MQVTLLVPDKAAAESASKVAGVSKVLVADSDALRRGIAEPYSGLVASLQQKHSELSYAWLPFRFDSRYVRCLQLTFHYVSLSLSIFQTSRTLWAWPPTTERT